MKLYLILILNKLIILLLFIFISLFSFGQYDYIIKKNTTMVGVELVMGRDITNSISCNVISGERIEEYSPFDVKEYGFKNGRVYISKEIQLFGISKRVFLERLVCGKTYLYYYKGSEIQLYFIEIDSMQLIEIPKYDKKRDLKFRDNLKIITKSCPCVSDVSSLVRYRKSSMTEYFRRYNNCELKPFPFPKFGLLSGVEFLKPIPSSPVYKHLEEIDYSYIRNFIVGIFIDNPISSSDYSLHAELYYSQYKFSYSTQNEIRHIQLDWSKSTIQAPILLRYIYPSNIVRPYINAGGIVSYNLINEHTLTKEIYLEDVTSIINKSFIDDFQIGYSVGCGIEYKLNTKNSLFFEFRYNKCHGLTHINSLNTSEVNFLVSINI